MSRLTIGGRCAAVAHRGNPVAYRENTLLGIADAIRAGADVVEVDVKVTRDGQVVLLHDLTLQRLWDHPGAIADVAHAELAALAAAAVGIPTLSEALALVSGFPCSLLVDMDAPEWAAPSLAVVRDCVAEGLVTPEQIAWCGRDDSLRVIRDADPRARIVLSWDESNGNGDLPSPEIVTALRPEAYNPHWPMVTPETIDWAHDRGLAISCWTVDDERQMRRLLDLGVDAMTSNHIATLRRVIDGCD